MKFVFLLSIVLMSMILLNGMNHRVKRHLKNKRSHSKAKEIYPKYGADSFKKIRIRYVHYDSSIDPEVEKTPKASLITTERFSKFMEMLIDPVNRAFEQMLKVYPLEDNHKTAATCLMNGYIKFLDVQDYIKGYDFVYFISFQKYGRANAASAVCSWAEIGGPSGYKRPLAGIVIINIDKHDAFESFREFELKERRRTFFHEMSHALALNNPTNTREYIDSEGKKITNELFVKTKIWDDKEVIYLKDDLFKKDAAEYFNCPLSKVPGFPMNTVDRGSHFDQQIIANTMMRPKADVFEERVSKFMLNTFAMTGWYLVNFSYAEPTLWGKGRGCNFLNLECKDEQGKLFPEYCDSSNNSIDTDCDFYYEGHSYCTKGNSSCSYRKPEDRCDDANTITFHSFEHSGKEGKCLTYQSFDILTKKYLPAPVCMKATCDGKTRTVIVTEKNKQGKDIEHKTTYVLDSPSVPSFTTLQKNVVNFPASFERFCFNILNPDLHNEFR